MSMFVASAFNLVAAPQVRAPLGRTRAAVDSVARDSLNAPRDTARFKKTRAVDIDHVVKFSSKDSIVLFGRNDLRFYGESEVSYDNMDLKASSITLSYVKKILPESVTTTIIFVAPASSAFSVSSFTTDAGRPTTSPAAIIFAICGGRTLSFPITL